MERRLYRSSHNKVLAGVCGGIGEYFGIDPVMVRLLAVIFTLMGGSGLIAYIIAALVIPSRKDMDFADSYKDTYDSSMNEEDSRKNSYPEYDEKRNKNTAIVLGVIFIGIGALIVFRHFVHWVPVELVFAAVFVIIGVFLIFKRL